MVKKSWESLVAVLLALSIAAILFLPLASALNEQPYRLKLLAVQENNTGYVGSEADLFLELRKGSGRVFLETKPLTKMDTQISTRFAKEIACKHFKLNCQKYDFIYTIRAESSIIGGPSAGAAIAALTTIAVLDLEHDEDVTITGTINSGGIVGYVGGVKEKLEAASRGELRKVLVAKGTTGTAIDDETEENTDEEKNNGDGNKTEEEVIEEIDLQEYAKQNLSIEMVEVMDLDEVIYHLTGKNLNHQAVNITENQQYAEIMEGLRNILCERTEKTELELKQEGVILDENTTQKLAEKKEEVQKANANQDYYSAASFCFGNNILLRSEYYKHKEPSKPVVRNLFNMLQKKTDALEEKLGAEEITTISDLQTLMIVKERLDDVKQNIAKLNESSKEESYELLAYAEERYFSAISWRQFFAMEGKRFVMNKETLKESCQQKISEAEERHQYASLFLGSLPVLNIQQKIEAAEKSLQEEEFELCLIVASQAKADANAILSSLGLSADNFAEFINSKQQAAERVISENSAEGIFPILGYSYYQYANSLKEQEQEQYTALIYIEYALEMSELSIYFPEEQEFMEPEFTLPKELVLVGEGLVIGILGTLLAVFLVRFFRKGKKRKSKR